MVISHLDEYDSVYKAAFAIGPKLGVRGESLRRWVQAELAKGTPEGQAGLAESAKDKKIKELERRNRDLEEANEILKAAIPNHPADTGAKGCHPGGHQLWQEKEPTHRRHHYDCHLDHLEITMSRAYAYFDESGQFLILPSVENDFGMWSKIDEPSYVQWDGHQYTQLGEAMLKALGTSRGHPVVSREDCKDVWKRASGAKSWRAFAKTRQMVTALGREDEGTITVEFERRQADYSFGSYRDDPVQPVVLGLNPTADEIGHAVIDVLRQAGVLNALPAPEAILETHPASPPLACQPDRDAGRRSRQSRPELGPLMTDTGDATYDEFRADLLGHFYDQADRGQQPTLQIVSDLIDEIAPMMWESPTFRVCALVTLAIVCLREGVLTPPLAEAVTHLDDLAGQLAGRAAACYRADLDTLPTLLTRTRHDTVDWAYPPEYFAP
jgi:hypothetical protein